MTTLAAPSSSMLPGHGSPTAGSQRPRVLLVDDEVAVLDSLRRLLRRDFDVSTAAGGAEALELLASETFAVVVSDMRMPLMDGAALLATIRERSPDTVRMLLTGQADTQSAISAINDGQIFRFLTKPCAADVLHKALEDAVALHRLVVAERELLEQTLGGALQALTDTLAIAHPTAFARAVRIARTVRELAETMRLERSWEIEVAAMLAHLGTVSLPQHVLDKLDSGLPLDPGEREMAARVPELSRQLLAAIPRLEGVATAVGLQDARYDGAGADPGVPHGDALPMASRLLHVAVDLDALTSRRVPGASVLAHLRRHAGRYDPAVLGALVEHLALGEEKDIAFEVPFADLEPGMVLMEDVTNAHGTILLGRGTTVTPTLLQRLRNYVSQDGYQGPVVVAHAPR